MIPSGGHAAERAGLLPGEVLVRVGDRPLRDLESLRYYIDDKDPGGSAGVGGQQSSQTDRAAAKNSYAVPDLDIGLTGRHQAN